MKSFFRLLTLALLSALASLPLSAQNPDALIYTVGNSYQTNGAQYDYFLWQPGDINSTLGKTFGIYAKPGNPDSATNYTRISAQKLQTGPTAILPLLKMAAFFDHDAAALPERIIALEAEIVGRPIAEEIPLEVNATVASALAKVIASAKEDPANLQSLLSLGRAHPGVMMCMGHAFACRVTSNSTHTYEVRELGPAGQDLRVIGRVTLAGAAPTTLEAPGPPIAISHTSEEEILNPQRLNTLQLAASGKDHLNARFRWGLSETFLEDLPRTYGFNLYRVPKTEDLDPNSLTTAAAALARPDAVKVNSLPVSANTILTPAEAANLTVQPSEFFLADDKNPPADPFVDGEEFYYYVAARDIAGHPGPLSGPTLVTICDRLPPAQAAIHSVENVFDFANADFTVGEGTGTQHLRITIRQTPDTPLEDRAQKYFVYRWYAANDWMRHGGDPNFNLIGEVDHVPGERYVIFDDNDPADTDTDGDGPITQAAIATNSEDDLMGKTVWYTVRSVDNASCVPPNMAGHSGAVYGVLRDRVGPDPSSGSITTCFCNPLVLNASASYTTLTNLNDPEFTDRVNNGDGLFAVTRLRFVDGIPETATKVKGFQLRVDNREDQPQERLEKFNRYFEFEGDEQLKTVVIPGLLGLVDSFNFEIRCFLNTGAMSDWTRYQIAPNQSLDPENYYIPGIAVLSYEESKITSPGNLGGPLPQEITGLDGFSRPSVTVTVTPSEDSRELRIYRRAGLGEPLQLIDKIVGDTLPETHTFIDRVLPIAHATEVCYYVMTLDEHANASALVSLGCLQMLGDTLPVPALADPLPVSTNASEDTMTLSWNCDPVGVDHFEVWAATETSGSNLIASPDLTAVPGVDPRLILPGANGRNLTFARFDTPSLAGGFGNDGAFSLEFTKPKDIDVALYVRAVGTPIQQTPDSWATPSGEVSNLAIATYREAPAGPTNVIPWPARKMPPISDIEREVRTFTIGDGPFYAQAIARDKMQGLQASSAILVGSLRGNASPPEGNQLNEGIFVQANGPFTRYLFPLPKNNLADGEENNLPAFPFALYRHQVASDRFPNAEPNLIQCTPLIDRIAVLLTNDDTIQGLVDPFLFGVSQDNYAPLGFSLPSTGTFGRDPSAFQTVTPSGAASLPPYLNHPALPEPDTVPISLWLRDPQPVAKGARYQYLLVHFDERGEIQRITPTNLVQH